VASKVFPGPRKGMGGQWCHIGGLAMHLLAFIFVLCLLFIFFVPFFTIVAVFQMWQFAVHDGDNEHILSLL